MKKGIIFSVLMIVMIVGVVIAVRFNIDSENDMTITPVTETDDQTVLTFWRNYGNVAENQAFEYMIASFERAYPNIDIDMNAIQYGDYELKLRTEIATGKPPDLMLIDSPNLALYARIGVLEPLTDHFLEERLDKDLPPALLEGVSYEDDVYLMPLVQPGAALYYNRHLFQEAGIPFPSKNPHDPMTWDEVLAAAQKITDPDKGVIGIDPAQGFPGGEAASYFKSPLIWQFGGELLSPDGSTADGYLNAPASIEALTFYKDLYHRYDVAEVQLPPRAFENGKLGMSVFGSWELSRLKETDPDFELGEDFDIAPLPKGTAQVAPNGGWSMGISSNTQYPDEAWTFISYMTDYEAMSIYVDQTGEPPARQSIVQSFPEFLEYPENIFLTQSQIYSKSRPVTPAYPFLSDAIKTLFEEIVIENAEVKEAADRAVNKIDNGIQEQNSYANDIYSFPQ
ncbi:ABC transporter substrate-binding protein [Jeotgalibacillus terrae]|uniref:ABC transporter substrate-binding protein n=1 Tax=Jeotgalibacillus terrae TaxID=587735 RepID=A0ABW5ZLV1_9BACL|nr:sugar ABC transporter substrate-binding protein [Jeotgalibacillus terrae]MBM7578111.1 ABC-type glycerol-3-phosphate transport system substrate-binding protein [Jeotgalibacillus terrae]